MKGVLFLRRGEQLGKGMVDVERVVNRFLGIVARSVRSSIFSYVYNIILKRSSGGFRKATKYEEEMTFSVYTFT